jgi:hypothetical protein
VSVLPALTVPEGETVLSSLASGGLTSTAADADALYATLAASVPESVAEFVNGWPVAV